MQTNSMSRMAATFSIEKCMLLGATIWGFPPPRRSRRNRRNAATTARRLASVPPETIRPRAFRSPNKPPSIPVTRLSALRRPGKILLSPMLLDEYREKTRVAKERGSEQMELKTVASR